MWLSLVVKTAIIISIIIMIVNYLMIMMTHHYLLQSIYQSHPQMVFEAKVASNHEHMMHLILQYLVQQIVLLYLKKNLIPMLIVMALMVQLHYYLLHSYFVCFLWQISLTCQFFNFYIYRNWNLKIVQFWVYNNNHQVFFFVFLILLLHFIMCKVFFHFDQSFKSIFSINWPVTVLIEWFFICEWVYCHL